MLPKSRRNVPDLCPRCGPALAQMSSTCAPDVAQVSPFGPDSDIAAAFLSERSSLLHRSLPVIRGSSIDAPVCLCHAFPSPLSLVRHPHFCLCLEVSFLGPLSGIETSLASRGHLQFGWPSFRLRLPSPVLFSNPARRVRPIVTKLKPLGGIKTGARFRHPNRARTVECVIRSGSVFRHQKAGRKMKQLGVCSGTEISHTASADHCSCSGSRGFPNYRCPVDSWPVSGPESGP